MNYPAALLRDNKPGEIKQNTPNRSMSSSVSISINSFPHPEMKGPGYNSGFPSFFSGIASSTETVYSNILANTSLQQLYELTGFDYLDS